MTITPRLATSLLLSLALCAACGGDDHAAESGGEHAHPPFAVWPADGSTVFETVALSVGGPNEIDHVHGTVTVQVGGDAPQVGQDMPENVVQLEPEAQTGLVTVPTGEQALHVWLYDEAGKATEQGETVTWTVEPMPEDFGVSFVEPADGATVTSPVKVVFETRGAEVSPAGENIPDKTVGHHHVIVDGGPTPIGITVPADDKHIHYGGGQTEAEIELAPGSHTLTMQLADGLHRSYGKPLSATIRVTVEE